MVEEWINKEIKFDNEYVFTRLGKDSVYNSIPTSKYKILVYTDSIGCVGCNLRLSQWLCMGLPIAKTLLCSSNKNVCNIALEETKVL